MQIRKTLAEIGDMLTKQSGSSITFTQTAPDKVCVRRFVKIDFALVGHDGDSLLFRYSLGFGAGLLAKSAAKLLGNIQTKKLSPDAEQQTLRIHLSAFGEFKRVLHTYKIAAARIENAALVVDLVEKQTRPSEKVLQQSLIAS